MAADHQPPRLTPLERRVVWTHRAAWFLWEGQFGVHRAASTAKCEEGHIARVVLI
jgi:hypothetical protein